MQMVAYRHTMASAKQIVRDQPERVNPRFLKGVDRLIAMSLEYQRNQAERKAAEEAARIAREDRIREQVARDKAKWAQQVKAVANIVLARSHYDDVIDQVAFWHGVTAKDIFAHSRMVHLVAARHDAMAAVFLNCTLEGAPPSLPALGRIFNRDHTTCLFALRKHGLRSSHYASRAAKPNPARTGASA